MKKYTTNKSKLILAGLTIPMVVSVLPVENVFAAQNEIPTLNVYDNNGNPKLEWATEMLEENILYKTGYETNDLRPTLNSVSTLYNPLHSFSTEAAYSGSYGYLLNDNSKGKGNHYNFPSTSSNSHLSRYGMFYFENGIPLSMTFKAKSIGKSTITPTADGGWSNSITNLKTKLTQKAVKGSKVLYLDSIVGFNVGGYITTDTDKDKVVQQLQITSIDTVNKTITLSAGINRDMESGENIKQRTWRVAFSFNSRTITNTDWETYSINTFVNNHSDYDVLTRGANFYISNQTNGQLMIDDLTFGYATEVEVFRQGNSIYKGYLSDFKDTTIKDTVKPNKVNNINSKLNKNTFNIDLNIEKPTDTGVTTSYTIQAIAKNGSRSAMSTQQEVTIGGKVTKYKYAINSSSNTNSLNKEITSENLSIPLKSVNIEQDYLHVQAVDAAGNVSAIQTFKLSELVDMSELQSLYDKLAQIENTSNYNDFISFIDEVESLYGTNIPQDVKDRIQTLAAYHGENTAFLELLEGDFILMTKDITSFGKVKLTAEKQILKTNFSDNFTVIDARGTQAGWKVNVSATPFVEDTFEGFVGTPTQLPIGTLAVNHARDIKQIGLVHESKVPNVFTTDFAIIDSGEVTVLNADKGEGMGEFTFNFGEDALSMVVDATTAKIDNKNYPDGITPYTSTITWNLITGP